MKIFSSKKRVAAIGVVTAATLVGGGMAYAYWTNGGTGTGTASTGTTTDNLVLTAFGPTGLVPGGAADDLVVNVDNPNTYSVQVSGLPTIIESATCKIGAGPTVSVDPAWFQLGGALAADVVPANDALDVGGLTLRMLDDADDQNACKGAVVGFVLTVG